MDTERQNLSPDWVPILLRASHGVKTDQRKPIRGEHSQFKQGLPACSGPPCCSVIIAPFISQMMISYLLLDPQTSNSTCLRFTLSGWPWLHCLFLWEHSSREELCKLVPPHRPIQQPLAPVPSLFPCMLLAEANPSTWALDPNRSPALLLHHLVFPIYWLTPMSIQIYYFCSPLKRK